MRRGILIAMLLIVVSAPAQVRQADSTVSRPKVAVVLSGGGAKGVAHIGALKVIEAAGIPIDMVCGTSMGALMGGLYCIGYSPEELDSLVQAQDWALLLSDRRKISTLSLNERQRRYTYALQREIHFGKNHIDDGGMIRGANLATLFDQLCTGYQDSMDFSQLPIPFYCVATDVVDYSEVDFHSGWLPVAMRASMAIPGVFTPVRLRDRVLVDGGLSDNFPVDLARQMGADIIIGVSVHEELHDASGLGDAFSILTQIVEHGSRNKYQENIADCDIFIQVDVHGYSAASFTLDALDTLIIHGEKAAYEHWNELVALTDRTGVAAPRTILSPIRKAGETPQPKATPSSSPYVFVGFRFDNEERGSLQMAATIPFHTSIPTELDATVRLGNRTMARVDYLLFPRGFTSPSLRYTFHSKDLNIYTFGVRTHNAIFHQHQVDIVPLNLHWNRHIIRIGARWDYYNYTGGILSSYPIPYDISDDHYFSYYATMAHSTEDDWYFPTHGMRVRMRYAYSTIRPWEFNNESGIQDVSGHWRFNVPLSGRLSIQPMVYGRMVFGNNVPLAFSNALGCEYFGHYVEQQMPFAGIGHLEYIDRHFVAAQLQGQYRIGRNHYVVARVAAALKSNDIEDLVDWPDMFGLQAGYSYKTLVGPLDLRIGWSNRTRDLTAFLNFGYEF
ncbi:MAG: patatin-like phospholipase family protein [Bacteroidales bacterium]|nr:patatin-like phospholipase family protein [Bacteroidales bacterium]